MERVHNWGTITDALFLSYYRSTTDGASHENEGFLKSLWHNITNHPAHQKKPEDEAAAKDGKGGKPDDKPKSEDGSKKDSGSGSG